MKVIFFSCMSKPLQELINMFTMKEGDLVVDPFAGTLTTAAAAAALNRQCICLDNDLDCLKLAVNRPG